MTFFINFFKIHIMDYLSAFTLGISMAADAMCASASDGIKDNKMTKVKSILIPLSFGIFQFGMPVIGYFLGYLFKDYITDYIPWIAFAVLLFLSLKSFYDGIKEYIERKKGKSQEEIVSEKRITIGEILIQDIATSIDALTIGFITVNKEIYEAMITFVIIGVVTFIFSLICLLLGKKIGDKVEKIAPLISGLIFLGLAIKFLIEAI